MNTMRSLLFCLILATPLAQAEPYSLTPALMAAQAGRASGVVRKPIVTIVDKSGPSPTGDAHDYVSYSRYYWPDPAKPDGMPFLRHDGRHNREQVALGDRLRLGDFFDTVEILAAAWRVDHDVAAAKRAGEWLRAWFVTPATRMNPQLDYAQVRLGHNKNVGNPPGVLDARDLSQVVDALRLLEDSPALTAEETTAVRAWFVAYLDWLLTSKNGRDERAARNNHGSWFLAQAIPIARYVGQDALARALCESDKLRIAAQIQPDGSQPEELAREDGLSYSAFNLEAQFRIAVHAAALGIDLWKYTAPNGASLQRAVEFIRPYNAHPEVWPHKQYAKLKPGFLDGLLREADAIWGTSQTTEAAR